MGVAGQRTLGAVRAGTGGPARLGGGLMWGRSWGVQPARLSLLALLALGCSRQSRPLRSAPALVLLAVGQSASDAALALALWLR